jgi:hypothetical protein
VASTEPEITKWYTRARRFPQLIGRTSDGAKIPFGPYTYTQVLVFAGILIVGSKTMGLWGRFGVVGNGATLLGVAFGVTFALGKVPIGARSPISMLLGAIAALTSPADGKVGGRKVALRRPHRVVSRLTVQQPVRAAADSAPTPGPVPPPAHPKTEPAHRRRRPSRLRVPGRGHAAEPPQQRPIPVELTNVQRLLAAPQRQER